MMIALGYAIISTGVFLGIYWVLSKRISQLKIRKPFVLTVVNFLITVVILGLFLLNPEAFSEEAAIEPGVIYILFSIFATYFYLIIIPLAGIQTIITLKNNLYRNRSKKYMVVGCNIFTICGIIYLSSSIF